MSYIGKEPADSFISFAKQDFTTSATTSYTLDNAVTNENELALFINFVRQEPTTAYTASGTSLTLTSATSASDDMYCVFLGKAVQTVNPPNGSVGTSQLADDAVTKAKTSALMYPAFQATINGTQTITDSTITKIQFDTEIFDTDSAYDATTNYRFTPQVAGKYFVYSSISAARNGSDNGVKRQISYLYKNGSRIARNTTNMDQASSGDLFHNINQNLSLIVELNGSTDYVESFFWCDVVSDNVNISGNTATDIYSVFHAYRIGD